MSSNLVKKEDVLNLITGTKACDYCDMIILCDESIQENGDFDYCNGVTFIVHALIPAIKAMESTEIIHCSECWRCETLHCGVYEDMVDMGIYDPYCAAGERVAPWDKVGDMNG